MKSLLKADDMKSLYLLVFAATFLSPVFSQPKSPLPIASASDWDAIRSVIQHPRCMNCHTVTEFPRQGDQRYRHQQLVIRGEKNGGAPTLSCSACHQSSNSADGQVPGAPLWHLAPLSMGWENLTSVQLCQAIKDKSKNGDRDLAALEKQMTSDPLVQWAWQPGARQAPSIDQKSFHDAVRRWVATGASCPA
jgi:hypothetical protein